MKNIIVVQKYGGTSVSDIEKIDIIADHIKNSNFQEKKILIVVSAMNKETDRLIDLAHQATKNPDKRELDQLLQTGESVTAPLLAMILKSKGVPAISLNSQQIGLIASGSHGIAKIKELKDPEAIHKLLEKKVLVVTGFQGSDIENNEIKTLGRGGSDASAVALAAALKANICEIYTDVDGVYAVDPRIVPLARRIDKIGYKQMMLLSTAGAGVLFNRSIEIAERNQIPLRVLISPSLGESNGGTLVSNFTNLENIEETIDIKGIGINKDLIALTFSNVINQSGSAIKIICCFSKINIIEFVQGYGKKTTQMSFLIDKKDFNTVSARLKKVGLLFLHSPILCAVTLFDFAMINSCGYAEKIVEELDKKINIEFISSSGEKIVIGIQEEYMEKTCQLLAKKIPLLRNEAKD